MSARRLLVLAGLVATGVIVYRKATADKGGSYDPSTAPAGVQQ
ncbi:hypothetical protein [Aeromicrobium phragmitis]|nr:hypothetical protein [Aeromicrobium phragmitis]